MPEVVLTAMDQILIEYWQQFEKQEQLRRST